MQIKIFGYVISFNRAGSFRQVDTKEEFLEVVAKLNGVWARARNERLGISPWTEWGDKEVIVTTLNRERVCGEAKNYNF